MQDNSQPPTQQSNNSIKIKSTPELKTIAVIYGILSTLLIATLRLIDTDTEKTYPRVSHFIKYLIPITPLITSLVVTVVINMTKEWHVNQHFKKLLRVVDKEVKRLNKELSKKENIDKEIQAKLKGQLNDWIGRRQDILLKKIDTLNKLNDDN